MIRAALPGIARRSACGLAVVVALCGGIAAASPRAQAPAMPVALSPADQLRSTLRALWEDHVAYTHSVIVSTISDLPDRQAVTQRLLLNQDQLGAAIKPYYGDAASSKLTALLREHIVLAAEVVGAARANDADALHRAHAKWDSNGNEIAAFLGAANPAWRSHGTGDMLAMHLRFIDEQVRARLAGDWQGEIRAYDQGLDHMLRFADVMTDGIVAQFPSRFAGSATPLSRTR